MIEIDQVSKRYKLYRSPLDRLKERMSGRTYHTLYNALTDITLHIDSGQTVGILGQNGAGKSTLLKLMSGVILPDSGRIRIEGRITALLELGTGFDHELSGEDNIRMNGLLIGMSADEITEKHASIIAFSELGEYIHEPVKTYSSGMVMRLAFAIAIHAEPSCFLVDEALSVGDAHFQQKCFRRIREFRSKGGSIVFVSHDLNAVKILCDRVVVIEKGSIVFDGAPEEAVNYYNRLIAQIDDEPVALQSTDFGSREIAVSQVTLSGRQSGSSIVSSGEDVTVTVAITSTISVSDVTVGLMIRDRFGQDIFGTNSHLMGTPIPVEAGMTMSCRFSFPMNLAPGHYSLSVALHSEETHLEQCYHWCDNIAAFEVAGIVGHPFVGLCRLPATIHVDETV